MVEYLDALLEAPGQVLRAGSSHWARFTELCKHLQLRGNLVPDAYLAALALEQGAERSPSTVASAATRPALALPAGRRALGRARP